MRAEADAVGVGDADTGGNDVVDHAGELVDTEDGHRSADAQTRAHGLEVLERARAVVGPHDVREQTEDAVEVESVRLDETVRQQVQAQVAS